jgi:hypothetical protein
MLNLFQSYKHRINSKSTNETADLVVFLRSQFVKRLASPSELLRGCSKSFKNLWLITSSLKDGLQRERESVPKAQDTSIIGSVAVMSI